jgi:hypothetical protein
MGQIMNKAEAFIKNFQAWAEQQRDIRGAFLIGSHGQKSADALSDLDIAFLSTKAATYADSRAWLSRFGTVWSMIYDTQDPISGLPTSASLFTAFSDGLSVDFSIIPSQKTKLWLMLIQNRWLQETFWARETGQAAYLFQQGIITLFDKDGLVGQLDNLKRFPVWTEASPTAKDFAFLQDDFYFTLVQMRRLLLRGQTYAAISLRDKALRRVLVQLVRWQAQAKQNDWSNPLKYRDKYLEDWADKRFVEALPIIFAGYGIENLWQALLKACEIFAILSQELALHFNVTLYERLASIRAWLEIQYQER